MVIASIEDRIIHKLDLVPQVTYSLAGEIRDGRRQNKQLLLLSFQLHSPKPRG